MCAQVQSRVAARAGSISAEVSGHNSGEDSLWTVISSSTKLNTEASPSIRGRTCKERNKDNFYITGASGTPVAAWFRTVLRTKHLADIAVFPSIPSDFDA